MGQYINLNEITTDTSGNPVVSMSPADKLAMRINSLFAATSGRDPGSDPTKKRDRVSGAALKPLAGAVLELVSAGGAPAWGSPNNNTAGEAFQHGLGLRWCVITAVYIDAVTAVSAALTSPWALHNGADDLYKQRGVSYYGTNIAGNAGKWLVAGVSASATSDPRPGVAGWRIVRSDWSRASPDSATTSLRLSIDGGPATNLSTAAFDPVLNLNDPAIVLGSAGGSFRIGTAVGDLYIFANAGQSDATFDSQATQMVQLLKSQYGIP